MVFASIVEFAAVSYIGHIRQPAPASASTQNVNGACNRLKMTSTFVDRQVSSDGAGRSAVVIVNRDASRRHLSIPNTSSCNLVSSLCRTLASLLVDKLLPPGYRNIFFTFASVKIQTGLRSPESRCLELDLYYI